LVFCKKDFLGHHLPRCRQVVDWQLPARPWKGGLKSAFKNPRGSGKLLQMTRRGLWAMEVAGRGSKTKRWRKQEISSLREKVFGGRIFILLPLDIPAFGNQQPSVQLRR